MFSKISFKIEDEIKTLSDKCSDKLSSVHLHFKKYEKKILRLKKN